MIHRPRLNDWSLSKAPWYAYLGGPCGVVFISASILLGKKLGATLYFVLLVTGCLVTSTVFDATGFLGLKKQNINPQKIVGVILLFIGLLLIQDYEAKDSDLEPWEHGVYAVMVLLTGFFLPMQALANKTMAATVGTPYRAATISFGGGVITAFVVCVVLNLAYGTTSSGHDADWWAFTGGLLGMIFVTSATMSVPVIGAVWYFCLQVGSQVLTAFFFDTFAWLSFKETPVTVLRVCGVATAVLAVLVYSTHSFNPCLMETDPTLNAPDNDNIDEECSDLPEVKTPRTEPASIA
ncbi:TC.BAT2 [Diplonema papillatum]|nr:TC.BAT2 [Diplonema papillatum]